MKVGTDAVLLGAWATGGQQVLDIGTGTGIIALMMAQRFAKATVEGIEIDPNAACQAAENVAATSFAQRVSIHPCALQTFTPTHQYDAIVTNPPYFSTGSPNATSPRTTARHTDSLPFADIFSFVKKWMDDKGTFSAIIPTEVMEDFASKAFLSGLFLTRQVMVKTRPHKQPSRCLLSFGKHRPTHFQREMQVLSDSDGKRSSWHRELTRDFYLT